LGLLLINAQGLGLNPYDIGTGALT